MTLFKLTEINIKANIVRAIVETSFIIIRVAISCWAISVNNTNKLSLDNNVVTTVLWADWRSGAAVPETITFIFWASKTEWSRKAKIILHNLFLS